MLLKRGWDRGAPIYMEGTERSEYTGYITGSQKYVPVNARTLEVASGF